jgi:hypothetical protein
MEAGTFILFVGGTALALVVMLALIGLLLMIAGARSLRETSPWVQPRPLIPQLQPGDCLLYRPKGVFGWIIAIKTWHAIAHCEGYVGYGRSVASRDGIGVGEYPLREAELLYVLRPTVPFDVDAAMAAFRARWQGQGYDYLGLLRFAWRAPVRDRRFDNRQFCSEFLTRWCRAGGFDPFNGEDADAIVPFQFLLSNCYVVHQVRPDGAIVPRGEVVYV